MKKIIMVLSIAYLSMASNALAFSVKHELFVTIGMFDASSTSFEYGFDKNKYHLISDVKTSGFFDTMYPFNATYTTSGNIVKNKFQATTYKYTSQSRSSKRSREIVFDNKGNPIASIGLKDGKENKKEITETFPDKDASDLQTVFAMMAKQYSSLGFCEGRLAIFDGKRRFDVIFQDDGESTLEESPLSPFKGKAHKCLMTIDKLSEQTDDLLWKITEKQPIHLWIMRDKKTNIPFIARIEIKNTILGRLIAKTTKVTINE